MRDFLQCSSSINHCDDVFYFNICFAFNITFIPYNDLEVIFSKSDDMNHINVTDSTQII